MTMRVFAWGAAESGQLGFVRKDKPFISEPTKVDFFDHMVISSLAIGDDHTLVLTSDGLVYSCGSNNLGQLGRPSSDKPIELIPKFESYQVQSVSAGKEHSVVITCAGDLFSFGSNIHGQLGLGSQDTERHVEPKLVKALATKRVIQVSCGEAHTLALTNDSLLYSWGLNDSGQLGHGRPTANPEPITSVIGLPIQQITCGGNHSFLLTCSGAMFGWGKNTDGQLGLNDTEDRRFPCLCKPLRNQFIKYIVCGYSHTVVLTKNGGVYSFGHGQYGQLGHSSSNNEILPKVILELMGSEVIQIACGRYHTVVYRPSRGQIYSFGLNSHGQLGTPSMGNSDSPSIIHGPFRSPSDTMTPTYIVIAVYSGGDQCYSLAIYNPSELNQPLDFRETNLEHQIPRISKDSVIRMHSLDIDDMIPVDLADYIEITFGSLGCVNASFLQHNDGHYCCNKTNHGLSLDLVTEVFNLLNTTSNKAVLNLITFSLERLLSDLVTFKPPDVEALRVFLILPLCPFFDADEHASTLVLPYACAFNDLTESASVVLGLWWSEMKPSYISRLVTVYKKCVLGCLKQERQPAKKSEYLVLRTKCMQLLKKLHSVNDLANQIVPYTLFYINELDTLVDLSEDYCVWLKNMKTSGGTFKVASFCDYPFVFNATAKSILLQTDAQLQMQMAVDEAIQRTFQSMFMPVNPSNPCLVFCVSRENIVHDTLNQIMKQENVNFKKPLQVFFKNEDAMDIGGVKKEYFMLVIRDILNPQYGMFTYHEESRLLWFRHTTFEDGSMFNLIGLLCGLAIYNKIIIDLHFPLALFKKFLFRPVTLDDLKELMPSVGRNLQSMLDYEGGDIEDVFNVTFAVTEETFGQVTCVDLIPGGSNILVTADNKHHYVQRYVDYIFNVSVKTEYEAFYEGFYKVCGGGHVLELFHPMELQALVLGNEEYDWDLFEKNAEYKEGYNKQHPTIKLFWAVFHELTLEQKKKFLLFLTGNDRVPIFGMAAVPIIIQSVRGGDDFFPVAHTCFNLLDLPVYHDKDKLRDKLLTSIEHTEGFTLV